MIVDALCPRVLLVFGARYDKMRAMAWHSLDKGKPREDDGLVWLGKLYAGRLL